MEFNLVAMPTPTKEMIYTKKLTQELLYNYIYRGYHFYIMNLGSHPTAYVELPQKHKYFGKSYSDMDINVHGGLTYSCNSLRISKSTTMENSWFIGWDYAHAGDYYESPIEMLDINDTKAHKYTVEEIIGECLSVIDQLEEV